MTVFFEIINTLYMYIDKTIPTLLLHNFLSYSLYKFIIKGSLMELLMQISSVIAIVVLSFIIIPSTHQSLNRTLND